MSKEKQSTSKQKSSKKRSMSDSTFADFEASLHQALAHARGKQTNARVTLVAKPQLPAAPPPMPREQIVRIRENLNVSQTVFARVLNVSPRTVQAWEQGKRVPSDAALKLLTIAAAHPEIFIA